ncbi:MAG: hypothetical protein GC160_24495 [Acidobacteria bacterium]|nr:hypothetical protein [Acidobacteriota bacterium]
MGRANVSTTHDRITLVNALADLSQGFQKTQAKDFLEGLSRDELSYIADFFGASVLDPDLKPGETRAAAALCVERFQRGYSDASASCACMHKMILLLEFLSLSQLPGAFATYGGRA